MQRITLTIALASLLLAIFACLRPALVPAAHAGEGPDAWKQERAYPPLVFSSKAWLDCSISSAKNGLQVMSTLSGQGFSFSAPMLPIKDGVVMVAKPGMKYKFNSFPVSAVPARFTGLGSGTITEMKAEVEVDVKRFKQPGGPGTTIRFVATDISADSAYVEFTGVFVRGNDRKRFPFRVVFGSVPTGGGTVVPAGPGPKVPLMSKSVSIGTRSLGATVTTALYEAEDDVRPLK